MADSYCKIHGRYSGDWCPGCRKKADEDSKNLRREADDAQKTARRASAALLLGSAAAAQSVALGRVRVQAEMAEAAERIKLDRMVAEAEVANIAMNLEVAKSMGTCSCCGQRFVDVTRVKMKVGVTWSGVLGRFADEGVCPKCYFDRFDHAEEREWGDDEWREQHSSEISSCEDVLSLRAIAFNIASSYPDIALTARDKAIAIETKAAEKAKKLKLQLAEERRALRKQREEEEEIETNALYKMTNNYADYAEREEEERIETNARLENEIQRLNTLVGTSSDAHKILAELQSIRQHSTDLHVAALEAIVKHACSSFQIDGVLNEMEQVAPSLYPQAKRRIDELREMENDRSVQHQLICKQEQAANNKRMIKFLLWGTLCLPVYSIGLAMLLAMPVLVPNHFVGTSTSEKLFATGFVIGIGLGMYRAHRRAFKKGN